MSFSDFKSIKADCETRMNKALDALKKDFSGLRTGRASTSMLEDIMVDAYGAVTPLNQALCLSKFGIEVFQNQWKKLFVSLI